MTIGDEITKTYTNGDGYEADLVGLKHNLRRNGWETAHTDPGPPFASPEFQVHDQLNRSDYLRLGGGVSYSLTGSVDVNVFGYGTVWGRNDVDMMGYGASLTWSASPAQLIKKKRGQEPPQ